MGADFTPKPACIENLYTIILRRRAAFLTIHRQGKNEAEKFQAPACDNYASKAVRRIEFLGV